MKANHLKIGTRLGVGLSLVLGLAVAMFALTLAATSRTTAATVTALQDAAHRKELLYQAKESLLLAGVAIRNIGLQPDVEGTQREEKLARAQRKRFSEDLERLMQADLPPQAAPLLQALHATDQAIDKPFTEAVKHAMAFDPEGSARFINTQIEPAFRDSLARMKSLVELEDARAAQMLESSAISAHRVRQALLAGCFVAVAIAGLVGWLLARSITAPIARAVQAARDVASGRLRIAIDDDYGRDETSELLASLRAMAERLSQIVVQVRESAGEISTASEEVAAGNADLSHRTEDAAAITQQTVTTVEQIGHMVAANAGHAREATRLVHSAVEVAERGGQVVTQVVSTMDRITDSSKRIADITAVIDGIAFQTNILALNAAVEAARAGEHGRGFAVVAAEVRTLAHRSASAAREIKQLIQQSGESVGSGAMLVGQAGQTMTQIVASVKSFSEFLQQVSAASHAQAGGIERIREAIGRIDDATQRNASMVEQAAAASATMKQQSGRLIESIGAFKI